MTRWLWPVLAGCGRLAFDPLAPDPDAPFSSPRLVGELTADGDADDPTLTTEMTEIYFHSTRSGNDEIWFATRADAKAPWSVPQLATELSSPSVDMYPEISGDGLTIFLTSDRAGTTMLDLYVATRATRTAPWSAPVRVDELATTRIDSGAAPTSDLRTLYFSSNRSLAGAALYVATRESTTAGWGQPTMLGELDSAAADNSPFPALDGLLLFYGSHRTDGQGSGDLWQASRAATNVPFDPPRPVAELNTPADDSDPWLSEDLGVIYFSSNVSGARAIYIAPRQLVY